MLILVLLHMISSFTHCLNEPKMQITQENATEHHGQSWKCCQANSKKKKKNHGKEFCADSAAHFLKISFWISLMPNEKENQISVRSTSESSWIADVFALRRADVLELDVSHVLWRQGHLLRFEDKHGKTALNREFIASLRVCWRARVPFEWRQWIHPL